MEVHSQSVYFEIQDYSLILCCSEHYGRIPFALSFGEDSLVQLRSMVRFGMNAVFLHDGIYLSEAAKSIYVVEMILYSLRCSAPLQMHAEHRISHCVPKPFCACLAWGRD